MCHCIAEARQKVSWHEIVHRIPNYTYSTSLVCDYTDKQWFEVTTNMDYCMQYLFLGRLFKVDPT